MPRSKADGMTHLYSNEHGRLLDARSNAWMLAWVHRIIQDMSVSSRLQTVSRYKRPAESLLLVPDSGPRRCDAVACSNRNKRLTQT